MSRHLLTIVLVDPSILVVEVLPVDSNKLNYAANMDGGPVTILRFAIPSLDGPHAALSQDPVDTRRSWLSAFRRCLQFTLCSMSVLSRDYDPQLDLAADTHQTVFSLLASGLPLPKSPSALIGNLQDKETDHTTTQERKERGWWRGDF